MRLSNSYHTARSVQGEIFRSSFIMRPLSLQPKKQSFNNVSFFTPLQIKNKTESLHIHHDTEMPTSSTVHGDGLEEQAIPIVSKVNQASIDANDALVCAKVQEALDNDHLSGQLDEWVIGKHVEVPEAWVYRDSLENPFVAATARMVASGEPIPACFEALQVPGHLWVIQLIFLGDLTPEKIGLRNLRDFMQALELLIQEWDFFTNEIREKIATYEDEMEVTNPDNPVEIKTLEYIKQFDKLPAGDLYERYRVSLKWSHEMASYHHTWYKMLFEGLNMDIFLSFLKASQNEITIAAEDALETDYGEEIKEEDDLLLPELLDDSPWENTPSDTPPEDE